MEGMGRRRKRGIYRRKGKGKGRPIQDHELEPPMGEAIHKTENVGEKHLGG